MARIRSEKAAVAPLLRQIRNDTNSAAIESELLDRQDTNPESYRWVLAKARAGRKGEHSSSLQSLNELAGRYRTKLSEEDNVSLPLIAFYPVERAVLDIPLKIKEKHSFFQLDGYDNSLNQVSISAGSLNGFVNAKTARTNQGISQDVLEKLAATLDEERAISGKPCQA